MLKKILFGYAIILLFFACEKKSTESKEELTFDEKLFAISGIEINEITPQNGFPRQFEIFISQPLDHNNPNGAKFNQQLFLSHLDESAPVIFLPSGYAARASKVDELSTILNSNQIYVAHRFMTGAKPNPIDWDYLTIEQASADFHRIVEKFKTIYKGNWVSTGASKNGDAALFHKRFYPNDVDAVVAKVAPISFDPEDIRYEIFLENVGDQETREKLKLFQIELLERRNDIIPLIGNYMSNSQFNYSISASEILEFETLEYPFAFWQYGINNSLVPEANMTTVELYSLIEGGGFLPYYSDEYIDFFEPIYYQLYTELGYYRLVDDHLSNLLIDLPEPSPSQFAPRNVALEFNPLIMQDINSWLQTEGNNIIYVYGELDPWTAGAIEHVGQTNSIKIIQPNANHSIVLSNLDQSELVFTTLEDWLDIDIPNQASIIPTNRIADNVIDFGISFVQ